MLYNYNLTHRCRRIVWNKFIGIFVAAVMLFSCKSPDTKPANYNYKVAELIFSNPQLKRTFHRMFDEDPEYRIFKVLISRRDQSVRITIYNLFSKEDLSETPSTYFTHNSKIFLCYDGSEILDHKKLDDTFMKKIKENMKSELALYHSRVFQFDTDSQNKVTLHIPAINPYDFSFGPCDGPSLNFPNRKR